MFGNLGQLAHLLRNAGQIRQQAEAAQERLKAARFVAESGAGQVRATVDGRGELVALRIEPSLARSGDAELLEDLIVSAVREAVRLSREGAAREMAALTGLDLQGVISLLGGGPGKP